MRCQLQEEWLETETEERFGRLRWLAADDAVAPSASEAAGAAEADAGPRVPPPEGIAALGCRVGVWWIDDAQYYSGTVKEFDPETGRASFPLPIGVLLATIGLPCSWLSMGPTIMPIFLLHLPEIFLYSLTQQSTCMQIRSRRF